ncbi:MAG TPA: GTPase HflX, partial [Gammaproteobacteria bacterium]|nr:GTPase HflX [Gammaproteobacteria bacterium]
MTLSNEQRASGEKVLLLHVDFAHASEHEDISEFQALAQASGAHIVELMQIKRDKIDARYLIGQGKVEEIAAFITAQPVDLVI